MESADAAFLIHIVDWINNNGDKIRDLHILQWGWEVWAQTDIAYYLAMVKNPHGGEIRREEFAYAGRLWRADLFLWDRNNKTHVVELKCQSANTSSAQVP